MATFTVRHFDAIGAHLRDAFSIWFTSAGVVLDLMREHQVHNRTPVLLTILVRLPSVTATGRWREWGKAVDTVVEHELLTRLRQVGFEV